jgi:hypothetical protein
MEQEDMKYITLLIAAGCTDGALFLAKVDPFAATLAFFAVFAFGLFLIEILKK